MKIMLVCQYFYPEQFRVNDICFTLTQAGHQVTVLTGLPNYPEGIVDKQYRGGKKRNEQINGVNVIRSWLVGRGKSLRQLAMNYLSFAVSASWKAVKIEKDFDIILVYQLSPVTMALPGIILKALSRKPLVIYCHDLWPESIASAGIQQQSNLYKIILVLSRWIYGKADRIFTSSKLFEEYFHTVLHVKNNIVHLPVYAERLFENMVALKEKEDEVNLLFAGNIGEMQGVETILYAAKELKDVDFVKFHIVGDGSAKNRCEILAQQLQLDNVFFHGRFPVEDMPRFYQMADAFLITLKANKAISYTLPNKVQSYMAAGKPILGAIDGETKLVIKMAQCGFCGAAEDYHMLADNIRRFSHARSQWGLLGENGRKYYKNHFSQEVYFAKLLCLLKETVNENIKEVNEVEAR